MGFGVLFSCFVVSWQFRFFSSASLERKELQWSDAVLNYGKRRDILPTLKCLLGMQALNPISHIADTASASFLPTRVCCSDGYRVCLRCFTP